MTSGVGFYDADFKWGAGLADGMNSTKHHESLLHSLVKMRIIQLELFQMTWASRGFV